QVDLRRRSGQPLAVAIDHDDPGAVAGQQPRRRKADAARGARDQHDLCVRVLHRMVLSPPCWLGAARVSQFPVEGLDKCESFNKSLRGSRPMRPIPLERATDVKESQVMNGTPAT